MTRVGHDLVWAHTVTEDRAICAAAVQGQARRFGVSSEKEMRQK